jgi:predicted ATPase with chaperone activity
MNDFNVLSLPDHAVKESRERLARRTHHQRCGIDWRRSRAAAGRGFARAAVSVIFPQRFTLAAMNPCPCGYFGDSMRERHCTPTMIQRYVSKNCVRRRHRKIPQRCGRA